MQKHGADGLLMLPLLKPTVIPPAKPIIIRKLRWFNFHFDLTKFDSQRGFEDHIMREQGTPDFNPGLRVGLRLKVYEGKHLLVPGLFSSSAPTFPGFKS